MSVKPSPRHQRSWKIVLVVVVELAILATAAVVVTRSGEQHQAEGCVQGGVEVESSGQRQGPHAADKPLLISRVHQNAADAVIGSGLAEPKRGVESIEDVVVVTKAGVGEAEGNLTISLGAGTLTLTDADVSGASIVAVEPTPFLRRVLAGRRFFQRNRKQITVADGAAERLPVTDKSIDAVWAVNTMHHWADADEMSGLLITAGLTDVEADKRDLAGVPVLMVTAEAGESTAVPESRT